MRRRNAFTIVELLVAMALVMFIMAILSTAFATATATFRNLKAVGDMVNKLRAVTTLLQRDLGADHFDGKKRLSNPNFWQNGPPSQGYFRIWQGSPATATGPNNYIEGYELPGLPNGTTTYGIGSYRSTDHMLDFTIKLRGNQMGDFLTAGLLGTGPTSTGTSTLGSINSFGPIESRYQSNTYYNYQWGEVAWFLQPQVDPNTNAPDTTSNGIPLYTLYRVQRLAVPDNNLVPTTQSVYLQNQNPPPPNYPYQYTQTIAQFLEMSCWGNPSTQDPPGSTPGQLYFNSPIDLTVPTRRFGMDPTIPGGLLYGLIGPPAGRWPYPPTGVWPYLPPVVQPPLGNWMPPNNSPPTVPPYPTNPPSTPRYPTLAQQGAGANMANADIQATDVVSFDVRMMVSGVTPSLGSADPFVTMFDLQNPAQPVSATNTPLFSAFANPDTYIQTYYPGQAYNPYFNMISGPMVFDTWTSLKDGLSDYSKWNVASTWTPPSGPEVPNLQAIPLWNKSTNSGPILQAIQITIRVWDAKTQQTREVTIVQAM